MSDLTWERMVQANVQKLRTCDEDPAQSKALVLKVLELMRLAKIRRPVPFPGGETCKIMACIQLACAEYVMRCL